MRPYLLKLNKSAFEITFVSTEHRKSKFLKMREIELFYEVKEDRF